VEKPPNSAHVRSGAHTRPLMHSHLRRVWAPGATETVAFSTRPEGLSGLHLFLCRLYNENLWLYAIICTLLMATVGIAIAYVTDLLLRAMGMDVTRIEHRE
ncbi:MAG: hypothetical protein AB1792_00490, partial [Candidatus Zixiibacteriota bacterium]